MGSRAERPSNLIEQVMGGLSIYANTHGHMAATDLLKELAQMLRTANRKQTLADLKHFEEVMMTRKVHTVELKFDADDPERHKAARAMMRKMARMVLIQAHMIAEPGGRVPQAAYRNEDFFEGGTLEDLGEEFDDSTIPEVPEVEPVKETD